MPLSKEEMRALGGIERGLRSDDPRFVTRIESWETRSRRHFVSAIVGFLSGIALLTIGLLGDDSLHIALAVAGFSVIVALCSVAVAYRRRRMKRTVRWRRFG